MAYDFDFEICVVCLRVADMPKETPTATKACLQCVTRAGAGAIRRRKSEQHRLRERRQHLH